MRAAAIGVALAGPRHRDLPDRRALQRRRRRCARSRTAARPSSSPTTPRWRACPSPLLGAARLPRRPRRAARDGESGRTAAAFLSLGGPGLLRLADLRRGRRPGRDLHLVRRLGGLHGAARGADGLRMLRAAMTRRRVQMAPVASGSAIRCVWTDASQIVKTVAAAVISWVIAVHVFDLAQPFLAPWAALLTVHATVYRTFGRGAQQVGATVLGVLLAFAAGSLLGVNGVSLGVVLLVAHGRGRTRSLRAESTTAAATALVGSADGLRGRLGGAARLAAGRHRDRHRRRARSSTSLVWAPLHHRSAARRIDRHRRPARSAAHRHRRARCGRAARRRTPTEWIDRTRDLEHEIDAAWATVRQARESGRLNPRHARAAADRARPTTSR